MCMWICFLQWKTAKFPFKPCCWANTEISKFLLILHSNSFILSSGSLFLPPVLLSVSPALIFFKSWPSLNYYFSTLKCIFLYWFLLFSFSLTTIPSIYNTVLVNSLQHEVFISQIYCPIICPVKGKIYTTTQHPCSESALKDHLEDANFEYINVSQTNKKTHLGERLLYHGVPPTALATNRCTEKEPQKPRKNVKKLHGLDLNSQALYPGSYHRASNGA